MLAAYVYPLDSKPPQHSRFKFSYMLEKKGSPAMDSSTSQTWQVLSGSVVTNTEQLHTLWLLFTELSRIL